MKQDFFQVIAASMLLYGCITRTLTKSIKKKLDGNYARILLHKTAAVRPFKFNLTNHPRKTYWGLQRK